MPPTPTAKRCPRRSRGQWALLIDQQADSGLSVTDFCKQHQLGIASFYAWRRRLATAKNPNAADTAADQEPRFVRLEARAAEGVQVITADFPGGVRLTLAESALPVLIAALRVSNRC